MRICIWDNCDRRDIKGADGWCGKHYQWMLKNRPAEVTRKFTCATGELAEHAAGSKACKRCERERPVSEFPTTGHGRLHSLCVACKQVDERDRHRGFMSKPGKADIYRGKEYFRRYGITLEQYEAMLENQGGVCHLCGKPEEGSAKRGRLVVDHDHSSNVVRGLLCQWCNKALGWYEAVAAPDLARVEAYVARGRRTEGSAA